jgi:predicted PurR-regulated permease PerM
LNEAKRETQSQKNISSLLFVVVFLLIVIIVYLCIRIRKLKRLSKTGKEENLQNQEKLNLHIEELQQLLSDLKNALAEKDRLLNAEKKENVENQETLNFQKEKLQQLASEYKNAFEEKNRLLNAEKEENAQNQEKLNFQMEELQQLVSEYKNVFEEKNRLLNAEKEENAQNQEKLNLQKEELQQLASEYEDILAENEKLMECILQIYKKAGTSIYNVMSMSTSMFTNIVFPQGKWVNINNIFSTFFEDIRKQVLKYAKEKANKKTKENEYITELELRIICLLCIDFDVNAISAILDTNRNTTQQATTVIRKKLGMEKKANIKSFILDIIKNAS